MKLLNNGCNCSLIYTISVCLTYVYRVDVNQLSIRKAPSGCNVGQTLHTLLVRIGHITVNARIGVQTMHVHTCMKSWQSSGLTDTESI